MQLLDNYFPFVASHLQTMNATETHNALYGGMELSQLSWMERTWASYYIWMGNPIIATGLLSFVLHEVGDGEHDPKANRGILLWRIQGRHIRPLRV